MSDNLNIKYPTAFESLRYCYKDNTRPDLLLSIVQSKKNRYWPESGVNSETFQTRFPDKKLLLRMAKLATKRRIKYWHLWHMEVTHKTYSLNKDIDWFTPPTGDHEWIDSLVRFTHMIDLAAAYKLTHDKNYLLSFENYITSFSEARNNPSRHWKFLVNVAVRVINLIRAYALISNVSSLPLSMHLSIFENIVLDVKFILKALNGSIGNGAFFATTALLIASEYFGEILDTEEWQTLAEKKLTKFLTLKSNLIG